MTTPTPQPAPEPAPPGRAVTVDDPRVAALVAMIRGRTPARLLLDRRGGSYRTTDQIALRADHAAAIDAVRREFDPHRDWTAEFCEYWNFLEAETAAGTKDAHVRRPDLGRIFSADSAARIAAACPPGADLQIVVGDGLSAAAVVAQVPRLLPLIAAAGADRCWTLGRPIVVRHCRVGILNQVGAILSPQVAVLLVGERPGLRSTDSLSAYMAHRPAAHHTDAHRNLVSNIHAAGTPPERAAERIAAIAAEMIRRGTSGTAIKESLGGDDTLFSAPPPASGALPQPSQTENLP
jgi:ethanolamine ammonia-lyase small subunit